MITSAAQYRDGVKPNMLCGLQVSIHPDFQGQGLSSFLLNAMVALAKEHHLERVIVPVRPSLKDRYPITPIVRYIQWLNDNQLPFDPWLRVHVRAGGVIIKPCHAAMTIEGTIAEWEEWTGMRFFDSGEYIIPGALVPVQMDHDTDLGRYIEPNVWISHELSGESKSS
jgi:hypothetical protein